jgi:tRNA(adenine34) deaminase
VAAQHARRLAARLVWGERRIREQRGVIGACVMMMCRNSRGGTVAEAAAKPMSERFFPRDDYFMRLALREAERALEHEDVPIGAVLVRGGEVLAAANNERELRKDPTAHAEIIALREAARADGTWRVLDAVMYVTLEPCAMCAGAIVLSRLPRVVYGASDPKAGACGSVLDVLGEPRLNHRPEVAGGLLARECGELLSEFFASRR